MSPTRPVGAESFLPRARDLTSLRRAAAGCRGCPLWERGTQTVFGEGPPDADVVMVGEQPGDQEDRQGHPFVGPAGRVLDRGLELAEIDPARVYTTNAVKHFKWEARDKRRIHKRPSRWEVVACQPWFAAELAALTPRVLVLLGATAAQSVFGSGFRVTRERGRVREGPAGISAITTVHPSAVLRAPEAARERHMDDFVADLRKAAEALHRG
jgi:uracil-DNA glycosylase family protein